MRVSLFFLAFLTLILGACQEKPPVLRADPHRLAAIRQPFADVPNTENIVLYEMNLWNQTRKERWRRG